MSSMSRACSEKPVHPVYLEACFPQRAQGRERESLGTRNLSNSQLTLRMRVAVADRRSRYRIGALRNFEGRLVLVGRTLTYQIYVSSDPPHVYVHIKRAVTQQA